MPLDFTKSVKAPFQDASFPANARIKPVFDPADPFGGLTAGNHQFTVLADTDHRDPSIIEAVRDNIPQMARSGVKHIMLEYSNDPETEGLLKKLYARPPQISDDEFIKKSDYFESSSPETMEERTRGGIAFTQLILDAKNHGIMIHMSGDNKGSPELAALAQVREERKAYIQENKSLHDLYERWMKDPDTIKEGQSVESQLQLAETLLAHGRKLLEFTEKEIDLGRQHEEQRMSPEAEAARADRFIAMANGEKSVIFWGQDHFVKGRDLNDLLDTRLRQQAAGEGKPFAETRRMDIVPSKDSPAGTSKNPNATQSPDAIYYVREKQAELTSTGARDFAFMEDRPGSPAPQRLPVPIL